MSQAIGEVQHTSSPGFYSRVFLAPKPDGSFRPIIDLKVLNQYLEVPSFKMETLFSIAAALRPREWIIKTDLTDAYHHILRHPHIHKHFWFVTNSVTYQFQVLLFSLFTAPHEFTRTLPPVVQLLRSWGIQIKALDSPCQLSITGSGSCTENFAVTTVTGVNGQLGQMSTCSLTTSGFSWPPLRGTSISDHSTGILLQKCHSSVSNSPPVHLTHIVYHQFNAHHAPFIHRGLLHLCFLQLWLSSHGKQAGRPWEFPLDLDQEFLFRLQWFTHPKITQGVPRIQNQTSSSSRTPLCPDGEPAGKTPTYQDLGMQSSRTVT